MSCRLCCFMARTTSRRIMGRRILKQAFCMATVEKVRLWGERRIVLSGITWELYEQLRENEDNWHVRMAYDNGRLELMSPSPDHEAVTKLVARMIEALTAELARIAHRLLMPRGRSGVRPADRSRGTG